MATHHASSGEIVNLQPLGAPLNDTQSTTLLYDEQLRVMRLVLPAGKELAGVHNQVQHYPIHSRTGVIAHGKAVQSFEFRRAGLPHAAVA